MDSYYNVNGYWYVGMPLNCIRHLYSIVFQCLYTVGFLDIYKDANKRLASPRSNSSPYCDTDNESQHAHYSVHVEIHSVEVQVGSTS